MFLFVVSQTIRLPSVNASLHRRRKCNWIYILLEKKVAIGMKFSSTDDFFNLTPNLRRQRSADVCGQILPTFNIIAVFIILYKLSGKLLFQKNVCNEFSRYVLLLRWIIPRPNSTKTIFKKLLKKVEAKKFSLNTSCILLVFACTHTCTITSLKPTTIIISVEST